MILFKILRRKLCSRKYRDKKYLKYIRTMPCSICGSNKSEPHHIFGSYGSIKTSDYTAIPLCREHHNIEHQLSDKEKMIELLILTMHEVIYKKFQG